MEKKRILKEMRDLDNLPLSCAYASPVNEEDLFSWKGTIFGPSGSPYEGGVFFLNIFFPNDYPFKPPKIYFLTKIFHPNISNQDGRMCCEHLEAADMLYDNWSPAFTISKVLKAIWEGLKHPDIGGGCVISGLEMKEYILNRSLFEEKARLWTQQYAT